MIDDLVEDLVAESEDLVEAMGGNDSADRVEEMKVLRRHPHFTLGFCHNPAPYINERDQAYCLTCEYNLGSVKPMGRDHLCPDCEHPKTVHAYNDGRCLMVVNGHPCACGRGTKQ